MELLLLLILDGRSIQNTGSSTSETTTMIAIGELLLAAHLPSPSPPNTHTHTISTGFPIKNVRDMQPIGIEKIFFKRNSEEGNVFVYM